MLSKKFCFHKKKLNNFLVAYFEEQVKWGNSNSKIYNIQ